MNLKKLNVIVSLLVPLLSQSALAQQALNSQKIIFDGAHAVDNVMLGSTESHTLYQTISRPATCYRTERDGYDTRCQTVERRECSTVYRRECSPGRRECYIERRCNGSGPRNVCRDEQVCRDVGGFCRDVPDSVCRYVPDTVCRQEPRYRQVPYSCTKTETVAVGQELDFNVLGAVTVNYGQVPQGIQANEALVASLNGAVPSLSLERASNQLLIYSVPQISPVEIVRPDNGPQAPGEKHVAASFNLSFLSPADVSSPVSQGVQAIAMEGDALKFSVGRIALPQLFGVRVKIKRKRFLGDPTVVEDQIQAQDIVLKDQGARTGVTVALSRYLKEELKNAKYDVEIQATSQAPALNLLNAALLPQVTQVEGKAQVKLDK